MTGRGPLSLPSSDRLKDVAAINARSLPASTPPEAEIEYIDISNVDYFGVVDRESAPRLRFEDAPSRARRRIAPSATIVSSVRPALQAVAHFADANDDLICSTGFNTVEPLPHRMTSRFAYYVLISDLARQHFEAYATGVGYPAIGDKWFGDLRVPMPPMASQRRVAAFLDLACASIDRAVRAKSDQVAALARASRAILTELVTRGTDPGAKLRRSQAGWLGPVPEHWRTPDLKRLVAQRMEYGLNEAAELEDRELPRYIRITDFGHDGQLRDETFRSLPLEVASGALLAEDDLLFARSGATVGKSFIFRNHPGLACFAGYLIRVRPARHVLRPMFLYYYTKSLAYDAWKDQVFSQATIQNISAVKYGYLTVPLPPVREQDGIIEAVEERTGKLAAVAANVESQIAALAAYRRSLIHECVTGKRLVTDEDLNRVRDHA